MSETIRIDIVRKSSGYDIVLDSFLPDGWAAEVERRVPASGWLLAVDENVARRHPVAQAVSPREGWRVFTLPAGEENKTVASYTALLDRLLSLGVDRGTVLVAMGGGVVGDLCGFAAATVLRGLRFVQIPTTLLAQVDSSVGGKTGVNAAAGKNLVGAFHQPEFVLIDPAFLATLPKREYLSGMAEVVKHGILGDSEFFDRLTANAEHLVRDTPNRVLLEQVIAHCCWMKMNIVASDEKETGRRGLLNLGHTFGHVLESLAGFDGSVVHGEGVAMGTVMAARCSVKQGFLSSGDCDRIVAGLRALHLPAALSELGHGRGDAGYWRERLRPDALRPLFLKDKKASAGTLTLILLHAIGDARMHKGVRVEDAVDVMMEFV